MALGSYDMHELVKFGEHRFWVWVTQIKVYGYTTVRIWVPEKVGQLTPTLHCFQAS